jgi:hypothetical protein
MKSMMRVFSLALVIGVAGQCAVAGTVLGTEGKKCYPTTYSTNASVGSMSVYGNWIENIDRATTTASGVTVSIISKQNGFQNNRGSFAGKGKVTLRINTNNASAGNKTINLINDPDLGGGGETFTFTITVVSGTTVTSVDVPTLADPFKEITVTLNGTGLQEAQDPANGRIIIDNLVPLVTVGGNASVSSVRVLSSSATSLRAKIFFTAFVQDATVELTITSNNDCAPLKVSGLLRKNVRVRSTNIKNFVESVTFPNGNTFDKNSTGTLHINLLFPAPGAGGTSVRGGLKRPRTTISTDLLQGLTGNALANSRVFFKFVPGNAFEAVANGTPFSATGFNEVRANAGEDVIPITFKVVDCLGGQTGQTNAVKIQMWMQSTNSNVPPIFVEQTFNVRCTQ